MLDLYIITNLVQLVKSYRYYKPIKSYKEL